MQLRMRTLAKRPHAKRLKGKWPPARIVQAVVHAPRALGCSTGAAGQVWSWVVWANTPQDKTARVSYLLALWRRHAGGGGRNQGRCRCVGLWVTRAQGRGCPLS